jgi:hypothetical protein
MCCKKKIKKDALGIRPSAERAAMQVTTNVLQKKKLKKMLSE